MSQSQEPATGIDAEPVVIDPDSVGQLLNIAVRTAEGNAFLRGLVAGLKYPRWIVEGNWHLEAGEAKLVPGAPEPVNGAPVARRGTG